MPKTSTIKGFCNPCGKVLEVTGTSTELVKGVEVDCPGACGRRYLVRWRHDRQGDHGGIVQRVVGGT